MSLLKKRIQAKKMGEQRRVAPAKPLTDKPRIVAGLGIVLDTTKSEEFMAEIDRRISFKSRFAKETKDRQQKLAEMRGEVATAQRVKAEKEPWQMTKKEWIDWYHDTQTGPNRLFTKQSVEKAHDMFLSGVTDEMMATDDDAQTANELLIWRNAYVRKALSDGKPVPPEVLADYPDLKATAQKEKAAKSAETLSDSESRLKSRADKGNSSHFPIPSEPARARMCAKGDKVQGIEKGEILIARIHNDLEQTIKAKKEGDNFYAYIDDGRQDKWTKMRISGLPTIKMLKQALAVYKDIEFAENGRFKSFAAADKGYLIKGPKDGDEQLYWSNDMGWVDKNSATRFSKEEVQGYLPKGATGTERISKATAAADPVADLPKDVPAAELEEGASVEKEHGATYENIKAYYAEHGEFPPFDTVTEWIATDHLKEFADYYEALEAMEKELKAGKKPEAEAMEASAAKTVTFQTKNGKEGSVAVSKATNFDYRISKKEAERLLKEFGYDLPFDIMCKEYGQDEDWVGVVVEDLNEDGTLDDDYKTFELNGGNLLPAKAVKATAESRTVRGYWKLEAEDASDDDREEIAAAISEGNTSGQTTSGRIGWKLSIEIFEELSAEEQESIDDSIHSHISEMVEQGYVEGEIVEEIGGDDTETPDEPQEDDYIISSNGFKLSVSRQNTKFLGEVVEESEAYDMIRKDAKKENWYPNVWYISDHGNVSLVKDFNYDK